MEKKKMELKVDNEFKSLVPPLKKEEYEGLKESIIKEGCRDPLVIWDNIILDGHNRYNICMENGIIFKTVEKNFDSREEAKVWILENQLGRRNLNDAQRIDLIDKLFGLKEVQEAEKNLHLSKGRGIKGVENLPQVKSRDKLGTKAKVSGRQYEKGIKIKQSNPELWDKCLRGEISINSAEKTLNAQLKQKQVEENIKKQKEEIKKGLDKPNELFDIIVIDPPWNYNRKYNPNTSRSASKYPEMSYEELQSLELPIKKDCILWLWTTDEFIWDAKHLLEEWGFEYKTIMIWDKEKIGMGKWLRLQCEFCLLGIKGKPVWESKNIRDIIRESRTEHSSKPDSFYKMIDNNFIGKKLDYFGRKKREGWIIYGAGQNSLSE